jgi:hypothetical protein
MKSKNPSPINLSRLRVQAYDYKKGDKMMLISPELMLRLINRISALEDGFDPDDNDNPNQK